MSGVGASSGAVVRQGHLRKLKTMKKKFFVLRAETPDCSARLEYYESEKKFKAGASPRRVLSLKCCYNIMRRLDLKQKHVIALFTREEQFCIVAENEVDLHGWLSAILKQHRSDDASEELLHPIQHVWQVNVQKKGLGASKNIQGLYNLCLTDKTLSLVKIKSHNNVISDLGIPERVEYSLKNIRRCGDSECFFYMEVGRQTATGAGELWMLSDDSNIAQSMHSTIYHAMRNCAKESEHERDHIVIPKNASEPSNPLPARRQTFSDGRGRAGLSNDKGLCVGSCIRQCVCPSATHSVDDSAAAIAPLNADAENQPPNNPLTGTAEPARVLKHHRTVSLPTGCPLYQEPLRIVHERTRSEPLTGDEVDRVIIEKSVMHSSCKAINGNDAPVKKGQWPRRASTGARLSKLSPAHTKNADTLRNRCVTMPSRACASFETERPQPNYNDIEGTEQARDDTDSMAEWYRTPRIPEEPDSCDISRDMIGSSIRAGGSIQHSRTSSLGVDDSVGEHLIPDGYLPMAPGHDHHYPGPSHHSRTSSFGVSDPACENTLPDGYLPMAPGHDHLGGLISASSGSVCSGTPSTDPRFSEYQLDPATSYLGMESRPPRAYSVGSRPTNRVQPPPAETRHRAYSVGARHRPAPAPHVLRAATAAAAAAAAAAQDHMELDFSNNTPASKMSVSRTPPTTSFSIERQKAIVADEYVDMSPRNNIGYVEMRPGESLPASAPASAPTAPPTPDGYVLMNYGRAATRPITITGARAPPHPSSSASASPPGDEQRRRRAAAREARTPPHGSQTLFPMSLDSPASPISPPDELDDLEEDPPHHPLSTVREISEDGRRSPPPEVSSSPQYVTLVREPRDELSCNPTANKTMARVPDHDFRGETSGMAPVVMAGGGAPARFSLGEEPTTPTGPAPLNYAALDLEPRRAAAAPPPRTYTQIDFLRSEKLHAADGT